jgi:hypothetical protein
MLGDIAHFVLAFCLYFFSFAQYGTVLSDFLFPISCCPEGPWLGFLKNLKKNIYPIRSLERNNHFKIILFSKTPEKSSAMCVNQRDNVVKIFARKAQRLLGTKKFDSRSKTSVAEPDPARFTKSDLFVGSGNFTTRSGPVSLCGIFYSLFKIFVKNRSFFKRNLSSKPRSKRFSKKLSTASPIFFSIRRQNSYDVSRIWLTYCLAICVT